MSEVDAKTDAPTAEEIKGTKRAAEVSPKFPYLPQNYQVTIHPPFLYKKYRIFVNYSKAREILIFFRQNNV